MSEISFVTPYLSGLEWLELHLASIRKFHPDAEILISGHGREGEAVSKKHGAVYMNDSLDFFPAIESLFTKANNDTIVLTNHDTVLLTNINYLAERLKTFDLIGIEERIKRLDRPGWFRHAPGYTDLTFVMFSRKNAISKDKLWPKFPEYKPNKKHQNQELHYGFCEVMPKHYYLKPWGTKKYGLGNLIKDGNKDILWHQWFGSWGKRQGIISRLDIPENPYRNTAELSAAEQRFFADYPDLELEGLKQLF